MKILLVSLLALSCVSMTQAANAKSRVFCPGCDRDLSWMDSPTWWAQNPFARATQLQACRERRPGTAPLMRYCRPALQAESMAGLHR